MLLPLEEGSGAESAWSVAGGERTLISIPENCYDLWWYYDVNLLLCLPAYKDASDSSTISPERGELDPRRVGAECDNALECEDDGMKVDIEYCGR